ncbi:TPA: pyridoxal phosphate-dependent aminotransferase [Legionella pneumophila]|uniref:pyridoxal phosphate-dependent aminotransferase n=1 Tax=Legionella pneumophila TaxID=446 RepID=UPI0007882786|nr:pyridoxal phosphate-dependent aminotransferase [Legionella pneumophila]HBD7103574.1 pyridoxal phosphate-dependent aminotransferase [Legionella pneumophila]HCO4740230.1 pyridoxal phosphate-dependent aminotransferase [Legionella pneumophila]HDU7930707.1 pyridoxal phosphate-dependent aminotransferase [Legionella pneumophila]HEG4434009.1 pyridoxal phosphate-dependent aminotransferase [Legionella pneumophila]HEN5655496.1 pyridoxal phosphate-dependent aminotransferase [Legionella pneumophila]
MYGEHFLALRAKTNRNPVDEIFSRIPVINHERKERNLPPIIDLSIGEPHLGINDNVIKSLNQFLHPSETDFVLPYSPFPGNQDSLELITHLYKRYYPSVDYSTKEVMITNGATQGIWNALSILINAEDQVLTFEPYFAAYENQIRALGGTLIKIPTHDHYFQPSGRRLEESLAKFPKAKAIILNYPNNPTGIDLSEQTIMDIVAVLAKYPNLCIIIDDVYRELTISMHLTVLDINPSLKNRCIVVNSASKGLIGAPGLRAGMVAANSEWIERMINIQAITTGGISALTQQALMAGINEKLNTTFKYQAWLTKTIQEYKINKNFVSQQIESLGFNIIPSHNGFFILARANFLLGKTVPNTLTMTLNNTSYTIKEIQNKIGFSTFKTDFQIASYLMHVAGVAVVPGSAFGISESTAYLRFSCAKHFSQLEQACAAIHAAIAPISEFADLEHSHA